jgi:hypothetical protein
VDCNSGGCKTSKMHKHKTAQNCGCPEVRAPFVIRLHDTADVNGATGRRRREEDTKHVSDSIRRVPTRY